MYQQRGGFQQQQQQTGHGGVQPIISLTPFLGGKHTIKARVVDKSDIKTWDKPTSKGQLFSCTLIDETASIRATFFNEAVDQWFNMINNGAVVCVTGGSVKNANRRFSSVNNDYEMSLDKNAYVTIATDSGSSIPSQRYSFVPISVLKTKEKDSMVDVLGVITKVSDPSKIIQKATQQELLKRSITVADQGAAIDLTLWNDTATNFMHPVGTVLAMKGLRLGTYDGYSLSATKASSIEPATSLPDGAALSKWFQTTNAAGVETLTTGRQMSDSNFVSLGRKFFSHVDTENLGKGEKADFIEVRVTPIHAKADALYYDGCMTCQKKVQAQADGLYRCEKCDKSFANPTPRYMTSLLVSDNVTMKWITLFEEAGKVFWGIEAKDLKAKAATDPSFIPALVKSKLHSPCVFSMRVKEERVPGNDQYATEDRVKLTASRVLATATSESFWTRESENLLNTIAQYN